MDNSFGTRVGAHGTLLRPRPAKENNYALESQNGQKTLGRRELKRKFRLNTLYEYLIVC